MPSQKKEFIESPRRTCPSTALLPIRYAQYKVLNDKEKAKHTGIHRMLYLHIAYTRIVVVLTPVYYYARGSRLDLCCLPPEHGVYSCQRYGRLM